MHFTLLLVGLSALEAEIKPVFGRRMWKKAVDIYKLSNIVNFLFHLFF